MKEERKLVRLVCDRCSAEIECNRAWPNDGYRINTWLQAVYRDKESAGRTDGNEHVADLCPTCRDEFTTWIYTKPDRAAAIKEKAGSE